MPASVPILLVVGVPVIYPLALLKLAQLALRAIEKRGVAPAPLTKGVNAHTRSTGADFEGVSLIESVPAASPTEESASRIANNKIPASRTNELGGAMLCMRSPLVIDSAYGSASACLKIVGLADSVFGWIVSRENGELIAGSKSVQPVVK
jgi:hypothetical protein